MVCFFWCLLSVQTTYSTMCKIFILGNSHGSSKSTKSASRLLFLPSVWNHLAMCLSLISFPGLPTVQFWSSVLIACSMQNGGGLVHFITWMTSMSTQINNKGGRGTRTEKVFFVHFSLLCTTSGNFFALWTFWTLNTWINSGVDSCVKEPLPLSI